MTLLLEFLLLFVHFSYRFYHLMIASMNTNKEKKEIIKNLEQVNYIIVLCVS